jgi:hypothetical protein
MGRMSEGWIQMDYKVQEIIDAFNQLSPENQNVFMEYARNIFGTEKEVEQESIQGDTTDVNIRNK